MTPDWRTPSTVPWPPPTPLLSTPPHPRLGSLTPSPGLSPIHDDTHPGGNRLNYMELRLSFSFWTAVNIILIKNGFYCCVRKCGSGQSWRRLLFDGLKKIHRLNVKLILNKLFLCWICSEISIFYINNETPWKKYTYLNTLRPCYDF